MEKLTYLLLSWTFALSLSSQLQAQAPSIEWAKTLGGMNEDGVRSIKQTPDGGYIVAGFTASNDGDVSGNHGGHDFWVTKLSSNGTLEWNKCLGGSGFDLGHSIDLALDGGYIVAGIVWSNDGDVNSTNHGKEDIWLVKLTLQGAIEWQKTYGGSQSDYLGREYGGVEHTQDSGYIFMGHSTSTDGDLTQNQGGQDLWIVKTDNLGEIQWQKSIGGSDYEYAGSIHQTSDGGYILIGVTYSNDGDVSNNHGNSDLWVVKLNPSGDIEWQKCFGGSRNEFAYSIIPTKEGGSILLASTGSKDGDLTVTHLDDGWLIKLDSLGNIEWQQTYISFPHNIIQNADGSYVISGQKGFGADLWVQKMDAAGHFLWQGRYGGTSSENAQALLSTSDGGYIVGVTTQSNDIDVIGNHGSVDNWIVKLSPEPFSPIHEPVQAEPLAIFPNPAKQSISLQTFPKEPVLHVVVCDMLGREMLFLPKYNQENIDVSALPSGHYTISATTPNGKRYVQSFSKE